MDEASFSQSLRFMLSQCAGLRKCYDNQWTNAFLIGPITDPGLQTVGTPGRMLVSLVDEFIKAKEAANTLLEVFAKRNNDECFSRGLLSKSWHEEALKIANQTIVALQRFDSPWMRVGRNRFRHGIVSQEYSIVDKDALVELINRSFLKTVDTEMDRMPTPTQIAFVLVGMEREVIATIETITLRELFSLCKTICPTASPAFETVRGWVKQNGLPN